MYELSSGYLRDNFGMRVYVFYFVPSDVCLVVSAGAYLRTLPALKRIPPKVRSHNAVYVQGRSKFYKKNRLPLSCIYFHLTIMSKLLS